MTTLSTIGYEGASVADFIATLTVAGVGLVLDIRDVPVSRRPGFSKNILAAALEKEGIEYRHFKALGDPKPGREAARRGEYEAFRAIFGEHLSLPAAQTALRDVAAAAATKPSVLLCYERDHKHCHRSLVASALIEIHPFQIRHLGVRAKLGQVRDGGALVTNNGPVAIASA